MFSHISRVLTATACASFVLLASLGTEAFAWEPGANAHDWKKGQTIYVFVDPRPKNTPKDITQEMLTQAVAEAIKEWNDAQAPFGGLKLVTDGANKKNSQIHIHWKRNLGKWGETLGPKRHDPGFKEETVPISITTGGDSTGPLTERGITRILKHELGHAEGLNHSAESALMMVYPYSGNPKKAPTAADLNSKDPYTGPTADDKAGKKKLWGTVAELSESEATSHASFDFRDGRWIYSYTLKALVGPGLTDPVTEFTLDLPVSMGKSDFNVALFPSGWDFHFFSGLVDSSGQNFDNEGPSPSLLSFFALDPGFGIDPGDAFDFGITSLIPPANTRAFTNSPSFDSDEFVVLAPVAVPEPDTLGLFLLGALGILGLSSVSRKPRINRVNVI